MSTATTNGTKPANKSEVFRSLADKTGLSRKQVGAVFDALMDAIGKDLSKRGPGVFVIPGLLKLKVVRKPATKEREGINPFTGEKQIFKAKPARNVVKAVALKKLKQMV